MFRGHGRSREDQKKMNNRALVTWTIYDHPKDFPDLFVARKFVGEMPASEAYAHSAIEPLRELMRGFGLVCLARSPSDDPAIVETWI
jgi:hypothetical protein